MTKPNAAGKKKQEQAAISGCFYVLRLASYLSRLAFSFHVWHLTFHFPSLTPDHHAFADIRQFGAQLAVLSGGVQFQDITEKWQCQYFSNIL